MSITPANIMDINVDTINGAFTLEVDGVLTTNASTTTSPFLFDNMTVTLNNVNSSKVNIYNNVLLKDISSTFQSKIYTISTASNNNSNPSTNYDDTILKNLAIWDSNTVVSLSNLVCDRIDWNSNLAVYCSNNLTNPNDLLFVSKQGDQMAGPLFNTSTFQCQAGVGTLNGFVTNNMNLNTGSVSQMILQTTDTWRCQLNQKVTPFGNQFGIDVSANDTPTTTNVYNVRNKDGNIQHAFNGGVIVYGDLDVKNDMYRNGVLWNPLTSMPDTIDHLTINNNLTINGDIYKNGAPWIPTHFPDPLNLNAINCKGLFASKELVVGDITTNTYYSMEYNFLDVDALGNTMNTLAFISTRNGIRVTPYNGNVQLPQYYSQLFCESGACFLANNSATWHQSSDRRIKKNIKTLNSEECLKKILDLNPVEFDWMVPEAHTLSHVEGGFVAQEFAEVFPNMVNRIGLLNPLEKDLIDDGLQWTLQMEFLPQLVSSIQSLYQKITSLENEIVNIKNNIK